jgi:thymidylate kinase
MLQLTEHVLQPASAVNGARAAAGPLAAEGNLLGRLIQLLRAEGIRYCHWKGSLCLQRVLNGEGDLDLLVHRKDAARFESAMGRLGFKRAIDPARSPTSLPAHFYGLEPSTGILLHLDVCYRLLVGDRLLEDFSLPLEELLLERPQTVDGIPVAEARAAQIVLILRAMLHYASPLECFFFTRDRKRLESKLHTLMEENPVVSFDPLLQRWLPGLDPGLFSACVEALSTGASLPRRFWLARKLRKRLTIFRRFSVLGETGLRLKTLVNGLSRRLAAKGGHKRFASGGSLIAFVGPDASGKSTSVKETAAWLGKAFQVTTGHLGKPPSTWLTLLPNLARRLLRLALSRPVTPPAAEASREGPKRKLGLLYMLRAVLLGWDRRALAVKLRRQAARGAIVICDRYPSPVLGAADGARLPLPGQAGAPRGLGRFLARLENRLYRDIPPPDIVIRLCAPAEVVVERNRERQKTTGEQESDDYVRRRHQTAATPFYANALTVELDTNQTRAKTAATTRQILWNAL